MKYAISSPREEAVPTNVVIENCPKLLHVRQYKRDGEAGWNVRNANCRHSIAGRGAIDGGAVSGGLRDASMEPLKGDVVGSFRVQGKNQ